VYDHAVVDTREATLPAGAQVLLSKPPLVFASLAEPLSRSALQLATRGHSVKAIAQ
jgi:hypothetical protein